MTGRFGGRPADALAGRDRDCGDGQENGTYLLCYEVWAEIDRGEVLYGGGHGATRIAF